VAKRASLWRERRRALKKAVASFRNGAPEGLHDVRVALRRIGATGEALQEKSIERRARSLVRSLSERRQLEVDRQLLARVREMGVLSPDVAAGLDARWDSLFTTGAREAERVAVGRRMRRLLGRLADCGAGADPDLARRLQRARRAADRTVAHPPDGKSNRELHRYRIAVKKARYLAEDLALLGAPDAAPAVARLKAVQETLGRWNDVRLFRRRLARTRREAERRGAVTLALELDRLLGALDRTVEKSRADALEAARPMSNIVALKRRTA
jgi:CHAD domain-containing protein